MRLIDADDIHEKVYHDEFGNPVIEWEDINNAPTVDAVPVVRCSDCKYAETIIYRGEPTLTCNNNEGLFRDVPCDGFCYCGAIMDVKDDESHPFADSVMMGD